MYRISLINTETIYHPPFFYNCIIYYENSNVTYSKRGQYMETIVELYKNRAAYHIIIKVNSRPLNNLFNSKVIQEVTV